MTVPAGSSLREDLPFVLDLPAILRGIGSMFPMLRYLSVFSLLVVLAARGHGQPLHDRIDKIISTSYPNYEKQAAPLASDAEFLRRIYLDLNGVIPSAAVTEAFLNDKDPAKRAKLVDQLLGNAWYPRRMQQYFDVVLMDRRADSKVPRAAWEQFLFETFQNNKPYDQLVREILSADGVDAKSRPAAKFYLDRNFEIQNVTQDISRLFLGRNVQCAQCHDHPLIEDYLQEHYYGIQAFLNRSFLFPNATAATAVLAEKADGEVNFSSVFDKNKTQKTIGMKLPGMKAVAEPKPEKGKEYKVAPAKNVRPVPAFSRREMLAAQLTSSDHVAFRRTAANRLWAFMMGRGLVNPLDMDHSDNPPSHPALLDLLGDELAAHQFDVKWFLREIALSRTYQRSSEVPGGDPTKLPEDRYLYAQLKPLSPEQLAQSFLQATGFTDAERATLKNPTPEQIFAKLTPHIKTFVRLFGTQPGQPEEGFQATIDQTLFLKNNANLRSLIAARNGNLLDRAQKIQDLPKLVDHLYLSIYTRLPDAEERKECVETLARTKDKGPLLVDVIWAMLASAEFRFNH